MNWEFFAAVVWNIVRVNWVYSICGVFCIVYGMAWMLYQWELMPPGFALTVGYRVLHLASQLEARFYSYKSETASWLWGWLCARCCSGWIWYAHWMDLMAILCPVPWLLCLYNLRWVATDDWWQHSVQESLLMGRWESVCFLYQPLEERIRQFARHHWACQLLLFRSLLLAVQMSEWDLFCYRQFFGAQCYFAHCCQFAYSFPGLMFMMIISRHWTQKTPVEEIYQRYNAVAIRCCAVK